jgi:myo-inositol-1(or 4)-monophosphatase
MIGDQALSVARDAARSAGEILLRGFRSRETVVSYKSRTDLVTNMDRASEEFLVDALGRAFPDHAIIAEEGGRRDVEGEFLWYVDPLDGTNNYAHGLPFFCVSLGLFSRARGRVIAGVVYNPFLDELFCAAAGTGAFLNDKPIGVSATDDIGVSIVATGFPYDKHLSDENNLPEFNHMLPRVQGVRRMGSAALDLCYVACGRMDGYWERKLSPWDCAGGAVMVQEAGGTVTRFDGSAFDPGYPEILASNGSIHGQMIDILAMK